MPAVDYEVHSTHRRGAQAPRTPQRGNREQAGIVHEDKTTRRTKRGVASMPAYGRYTPSQAT